MSDVMTKQEAFDEIASRFRPEAARGMTAVYQLQLTGDGGGTWHMVVEGQTCKILPGPACRPNTVITVSSGDWADLVTGRLDGFSAVLSGRVRIEGDLELATRLPALFGA